jgi:hypothetical protein
MYIKICDFFVKPPAAPIQSMLRKMTQRWNSRDPNMIAAA